MKLGVVFILLSILSLWTRRLLSKLLLAVFLRDHRLTKVEKIVVRLSVWVSILLAIIFLDLSIRQFPIPKKVINFLSVPFFFAYTGISAFVLSKVLDITLEKFSEGMKKRVLPNEVPLVETYYSMISKLAKIFVFLVAIIACLDKVGFNVASLVTSLGVGSLAVGLAAKDTISNFISGVLLVTDRQFRIGDRVYLKDLDIEGYVYDIGLRTTRILTIAGNNLITIPNSKLTEGIIENALYPDPKVKDFVEVGVAYSSDIEKVKELLIKAVSEMEEILKDPPPAVYFTSFGDSALIFKVIYYVKRKDLAFGVKSKVHERILKLFRENGIEIPFPQRDIWFRNYPS